MVALALLAMALVMVHLFRRVRRLERQLQQLLQSPPPSSYLPIQTSQRVDARAQASAPLEPLSPSAAPLDHQPGGDNAAMPWPPVPQPMSVQPDQRAATMPQPDPLMASSDGVAAHNTDPSHPLHPDVQSELQAVTSLRQTLLGWFGGGNLIVRLGILVLLVGVVFLLRLAVQTFEVPIEARLGLVALGGLALTGAGLWLRERRLEYALTLQGGGLVVLYLTIFAALRLYAVLPPVLALALLVVLAVVMVWLAVWQDALALALLAFAGAYAAPILTSTGSGNALLLFGYMLVLNVALAWIAHRRTWRALNLLGALWTFGLAALWGWNQFNAEWRWPLEALLLAHMGLYWFIAVRYSQQVSAVVASLPESQRQQTIQKVPLVDAGLLFGVPLLGFGLQAGLIREIPHALALSSAVWAAVYLGTGLWLVSQPLWREHQGVRLLSEGALALGSGFVALVLPLAVSPRWMALGWAVQGAGLVWLGQRQGRRWSVWMGLALQLASLGTVFWSLVGRSDVLWVPLGVSALLWWFSAYGLRSRTGLLAVQHWSASVRYGVLGVAALVGLWAEQALLSRFWTGWDRLEQREQLSWLLMSTGALLMAWMWRRPWVELLQVSRLVLPLLAGVLLVAIWASAALAGLGPLVWLGLGVALLARLARAGVPSRLDQALVTGLGALLLALLPAARVPTDWQVLLTLWLPALWLGGVLWRHWLPRSWLDGPVVQRDLLWPVLIGWGLWLVWASLMVDGTVLGLPYVPLLSLLDLSVLAGMGLLWQLTQQNVHWQRILPVVLAGSGWLLLTGIINRTLHSWANVPLLLEGGWMHGILQSSLTVGWSILAGVAMVAGSRRGLRQVWLGGAALLGLVILKLVLVDLSNVTAVARVVSFMGAGGLMLLIGYLAPLPPARSPSIRSAGNSPVDAEEPGHQADADEAPIHHGLAPETDRPSAPAADIEPKDRS